MIRKSLAGTVFLLVASSALMGIETPAATAIPAPNQGCVVGHGCTWELPQFGGTKIGGLGEMIGPDALDECIWTTFPVRSAMNLTRYVMVLHNDAYCREDESSVQFIWPGNSIGNTGAPIYAVSFTTLVA